VIDAKVKDVLRRDMRSVQPETEVGEVARLLSDDALPSLPVVEDGRVVGVISQSDLLFQELQDEESVLPHAFPLLGGMVFLEPVDRWREQFRRAFGVTVREFVAPAAAEVPLDATLAEALRLLARHGRDALPVVEEGGHLVGVATRAELLSAPRRARHRVRLGDLIRLRVVYCFADTDVADAAAAMRAAEVGHLAVLGEDDGGGGEGGVPAGPGARRGGGVRLVGLLARGDLPPAALAA